MWCGNLNSNESKKMKDIPLNKRERSIIVYLSGYVVSNVYRKIRNSNLWESDASQEKLALLTAGKAVKFQMSAMNWSTQRIEEVCGTQMTMLLEFSW